MNMAKPQKAVFLDRDGTLIEEVNFLSRVEDVRVFPFTREALALLKTQGYLLIVITNQSGIGRGHYTEEDMRAVHQHIQAELDNAIDAFYFCPHLPDAGCLCRKPNLGMIESAMKDRNIDLSGSWVVGDKLLDFEIGGNAGIRALLVKTGYGIEHAMEIADEPDNVAENILDAARIIVEREA
jgi:D-glycero-D-manno-heptose 1,7-bisphosphate phosphatase